MSFLLAAKPRGRKARCTAIGRNVRPMDTDTMVSNILAAYRTAVAYNARPWYGDAHSHAQALADKHGITLRQACGIIAALSPSTAWERNLALASTLIASGDCMHAYGDAIRKAQRILNGADPSTVLGGRKVRSFFRNILYPHLVGPVTIDRHAFSIALGGRDDSTRTRTLTDRELKVLDRPGVYQMVAACYRSAARQLGIAPQDLQSITWDYWRDIHAYGTTANVEAF